MKYTIKYKAETENIIEVWTFFGLLEVTKTSGIKNVILGFHAYSIYNTHTHIYGVCHWKCTHTHTHLYWHSCHTHASTSWEIFALNKSVSARISHPKITSELPKFVLRRKAGVRKAGFVLRVAGQSLVIQSKWHTPRKWTNVPWKGTILKGSKRHFIFQPSIFRWYVSFQEV